MSDLNEIKPELAAAIIDVIDELAAEVDLYYEDSDIVAAGPAIAKMRTLVEMLIAAGYGAPEAFTHVQDRFQRSVN